jgi:hypothetical protein
MKNLVWMFAAAVLSVAGCKDQGSDRTARNDRAAPGTAAPSSGSARSDNAQSRNVNGTVAKASEAQVQVKAPGDADVILAVDPSTVIHINGQTAKASDISEGAPVRATYVLAPDGALKALQIEVLSTPVK